MNVKTAKPEDFERITAFYRHVIDDSADMKIRGRWIYGLHPTDELLLSYIRSGAMHVLEEDGNIAAAMAVTMEQSAEYRNIQWAADLRDDETAVIHVFCVDPDRQGQGLGHQMVRQAIQIARAAGKRAVRLDALCSNPPAQHLYESEGFCYRGQQNLYARNLGRADFFYYEYLL